VPRPTSQALVERFERSPDGSWEISGFASQHKCSADLVLLTADVAAQGETIVAVIEPGRTMVGHPYLGDLFHIGRESQERNSRFRFQKTLEAKTLESFIATSPSTRLRAWVFDVQSRRAYRMAGEWTLDPQGQPTLSEGKGLQK